MRILFDSDYCNGHTRTLHVFSQLNLRWDHTLGVLSLFEHDESPFQVDLDLTEIEELISFYEVISNAVGEQEISRRVDALKSGERTLASLALKHDSLSRFFRVVTKLARIIRFLEAQAELETAGFSLNDCQNYIQLIASLPDPPRHAIETQKRRRNDTKRDIVQIEGQNLLVKRLSVRDVLERDALRMGKTPSTAGPSDLPELPPLKRRRWKTSTG